MKDQHATVVICKGEGLRAPPAFAAAAGGAAPAASDGASIHAGADCAAA